VQLLLVGDGDRNGLLGLDQLLLHLQQHLVQHLLGILCLGDEVVEVALDESAESGEDSHGDSFIERTGSRVVLQRFVLAWYCDASRDHAVAVALAPRRS
jgi:hypothetical protein